jgi:RNA polymerase sigma-70 factor (ECF subfamily)
VFDVGVEAAFASLAADQQVVIRLVDVEGLSYQEAAETLGVPIGTVMSRLHRGRKKIKRKLAGSGLGAGRL